MELVKFGRVWEINSRADYDKAMKVLDENEFCANMSDDFSCYRSEMAEIAKQRAQVMRLAKEKGII
jgi:hypothetical protein